MNNYNKTVLITGSSGFIGFHLSNLLLNEGWKVIGVDSMTRYYDITLKKARQKILESNEKFLQINEKIEKKNFLNEICNKYKPSIFVHLAAQAGVRYSLENPKSYVEANLVGTFNVLEASKNGSIKHLLMASSSSVYGNSTTLPFLENQKCETPLSFYAATKKANEIMSHSYSHLYSIPTTMFRFFTAYGPWGRPDMALFTFTRKILNNQSIQIFNNGDMQRDFTYVSDLVHGIRLLIDKIPQKYNEQFKKIPNDSLSDVAPWRVVNIGSSNPINLLNFVETIENNLNMKAKKEFLGMQSGDVKCTWSSIDLLKNLTGFKPKVSIEDGIKKFLEWYILYHKKKSLDEFVKL